MALLLRPNPSRREFLRTAALSAGAILAGGCARMQVFRTGPKPSVRLALLADTHVSLDPNEEYRGFRVYDNMKAAVSQVVSAKVDGAIIAGDLARLEGKVDDYRTLRKLLEPMRSRIPVALALGNHDDRGNFGKVFRLFAGDPAPVRDKHVEVVNVEPAGLRFIILDSLLYVNKSAGFLGKRQRRWLEGYLDAAPRHPTFIVFHHTLGDDAGDLLDLDRLYKIILPRKQVKAIFYGHSHVYRYDKLKGLHLINIPAAGYNFSEREPLGWIEARMTREGGDFTLRAFAGNKRDNGRTVSLEWRG